MRPKQKPDPRTRLAAAMDQALAARGVKWGDLRPLDLEWDKPKKGRHETPADEPNEIDEQRILNEMEAGADSVPPHTEYQGFDPSLPDLIGPSPIRSVRRASDPLAPFARWRRAHRATMRRRAR